MSTLKYKNPDTGAWEKVGIPHIDAYSKTETDALIAAIPTGVEMDLLWENASPTSVFAAQTIELDLSNYAFIYFETNGNLDWNGSAIFHAAVLRVGFSGTHVMGYRDANQWRTINVNTDGITFGGGFYTVCNSYNPVSTNNIVIPIRIYGIKGVTTNV